MARGNQRDRAREATQKKLAAIVCLLSPSFFHFFVFISFVLLVFLSPGLRFLISWASSSCSECVGMRGGRCGDGTRWGRGWDGRSHRSRLLSPGQDVCTLGTRIATRYLHSIAPSSFSPRRGCFRTSTGRRRQTRIIFTDRREICD